MPSWASRTKDWCKPMATVVQSNPEEMKEPPVKNLCERSAPQRRAQLHSRSQEQILHLILAKRPRRYDCPLKKAQEVLANHTFPYGFPEYYIFPQLIYKRRHTPTPSCLCHTLWTYSSSNFIASDSISYLFQSFFACLHEYGNAWLMDRFSQRPSLDLEMQCQRGEYCCFLFMCLYFYLLLAKETLCICMYGRVGADQNIYE